MTDKIHILYEGRNFIFEPAPKKAGETTGMDRIIQAVEERDRLIAEDELRASQKADTIPSTMHKQVVRSKQDTIAPVQPLPQARVIHNRGTSIILPKRS